MCERYYSVSSSDSPVRSMTIGLAKSSSLSDVKSMTVGATGRQAWFPNTRRVIIKPHEHLAKSRLNSASDRPGLTRELSISSWLAVVAGGLTGRLHVGMDTT